MKEVISRKNVMMFIAQRCGISVKELFSAKEQHPEFFETIMEDVFEEFASAVEGEQIDLQTFNPYTQKMEVFYQKEIGAIGSFDELMESLSNTHKERMKHLNRSFHKVLDRTKELSKKGKALTRNNELDALGKDEQQNNKENEMER